MMAHASFSIDAQEFTKSKYGKPRKPVHWSNVHCNGDEQQIISCVHHPFSPSEKKSLLSHINVAGVKCLPTTENPANMNETMGNDTSTDSNEQTPSVLVVPTYLTMLMVIASLILSIV